MSDTEKEPVYESNILQLSEKLGPQGVHGIESHNPGLSSSGGNGADGMEPRIAKLEAFVETIRSDLGEIKPDIKNVRERMATLEANVNHLPSKGFIVRVILTGVAVISAFIAFQAQIQKLFGLVSTLP